MKTEYKKVPVHKIGLSKHNENNHEVEEIQNLAKNIEEVGLLNPITVTTANGGYEIIAGRARWRAFQELEREEIPAVIIKDVEEPTKSLQRADENYYRTNLDTYERAELMWNLKQQGLTNKELSNHFKLGERTVRQSLGIGEFLSKTGGEALLPNSSHITGKIIEHFRTNSGIPDNLIKDIRAKLEEAKEENWSERDVDIWKKSRKEGQLQKHSSKKGATVELERKQKEKSEPIEEQNDNRKEPTTKVKESEEDSIEPDEIEVSSKERQINQKEDELDQKDRILEQRQQKHRRERHKVQKTLANSKDNADQLRKDLQKLQQEDYYQYIDRTDRLRLIEILGDLVRESENTLNTYKEVSNDA